MAARRTHAKRALTLRLYVAGSAPNSLRAIENLKVYCAGELFARHKLEIVDLLKEPQRAVADGIIVTPTLIKVAPTPVTRVVGNLSDTASLLAMLGHE